MSQRGAHGQGRQRGPDEGAKASRSGSKRTVVSGEDDISSDDQNGDQDNEIDSRIYSSSNNNKSSNSNTTSNGNSHGGKQHRDLKSGKSEALYYLAVFVLVVIIFFSQFNLVGGRKTNICGGFGYMNKTTGLCNCIQGFYGYECKLRRCPFGTSWLSPPTANHVRNTPLVECSNMGICDTTTGNCNCRAGFDGRACERTVCPGAGVVMSVEQAPGLPRGVVYSTNAQDAQECSGHGRCRTLREAGSFFDGLNFKYPPVSYNNWDADKIQGCVCDFGWKGPDCAQKQCPLGKDPTRKKWDTDDVIKIECQATSGFFIIQAFGGYTDAIPFDADPAYLKYVLEQVTGVGKVVVDMTKDSNVPVMCLSGSKATTTIWFLDHPGNSPPIRVIPQAAASRMWPTVTNLAHSTSANLALRVKTMFSIKCDVCPNCRGAIQFVYRNSISTPISVTDSSAQSLITTAINSLTDLYAEGWTSFSFDVSGSSSICSTSAANVIGINFYSDYGNIPFLNIVDGSFGHYFWNITITSTKGNATLYECSNQGTCDSSTGNCKCLNEVSPNTGVKYYQVVGSDGRGNIGGRNDCGFISTYFPSCAYNGVDNAFCNGHGYCTAGDLFCSCYDGYYGMTCAYRKCPKGLATFSEPITGNTAHEMKECSGNGECDATAGTCTCSSGYVGAACQIKDCPRTFAPYGDACNGNGKCVSMQEYYASFGFLYGDNSNYNMLFDYEYKYGRDKLNRLEMGGGTGFSSPNPPEYRLTYPATWDALNWLECSCYGSAVSGKPPNYNVYAPRGYISGRYSSGEPMPGWTGYDCALRECPRGDSLAVHADRQTLRPFDSGLNVAFSNLNGHVRGDQFGHGNFEKQKLVCTHSAADAAFYFVLTLNGQRSPKIYANWILSQLGTAIEELTGVGRVRLSFGTTTAYTVCATSHTGGIYVEFVTELGDLPLMTSDQPGDVAITELVKGSKANLECGGIQAGVCNRETGRCECYPGYMSSDGDLGYGKRGDCSFVQGVPNNNVASGQEMFIDMGRRRLAESETDGLGNPLIYEEGLNPNVGGKSNEEPRTISEREGVKYRD